MTNIKSFKSFIVENDSTVKSSTKEEEVTGNIGYDKKVLIIGFGSIGQDILPIVLRHIVKSPTQVTVIEKDDNGKRFRKYNAGNGVKYIKKEITKANLNSTLSKYLEDGGFLIDVSTGIDCMDLMTWTFEHNVHYINTSLERWKSVTDEDIPNLADRTLYQTHRKVRKFAEKYPNAATAAVVSGYNPGCVSHYVKDTLLKIAEHNGKKIEVPKTRYEWAELMKSFGIEVIQISERDTQVISEPKKVNEFYGTWSNQGLIEESTAPCEFGYGTHEPKDLENCVVQGTGAFLKQPGLSVMVKSWVPSTGKFNSFMIQHSESLTLSEYFETEDKSYRPSCYYSYQPSDATLASMHEYKGRDLEPQTVLHIMKDEIISGMDEAGVFMITNKGKSYWSGSQLDIDTARKLIPGSNATSVQVVGNMLGTIIWVLENPTKGYVEPESIDFQVVLKHAKPYLGKLVFEETDWRPEEDKNKLYKSKIDKKVPNALTNFRVWNY